MSGRSERIAAVLGRISARMEEKDTLIASLREERDELAAARDSLTARLAVTSWAEDELGHQYAEGDVRRGVLKFYRCTQTHTKSLLRGLGNDAYWEEISE